MSRTDRTRWGAYGTVACTAAYGSMKLAQALGANALADKDPLPPKTREMLLARDPIFVASHWILATAAVVGIVVALATLRPWGKGAPRRLLLMITGTLGVLMIARAIGVVPGFGIIGDILVLTGANPPPAEHASLAHMLARWDLFLWSPFFLTWGACWATAGWQLSRRGRMAPTGTAEEPAANR